MLFCSISLVLGRKKEGRRNGHSAAFWAESLAANHTQHHHFWDGKDMEISSLRCLWAFVQMSDCSVLLQSQVDTFHTLC